MLKPFALEHHLDIGALGHLVVSSYGFKSVKGWKLATETEITDAKISNTLIEKRYAKTETEPLPVLP